MPSGRIWSMTGSHLPLFANNPRPYPNAPPSASMMAMLAILDKTDFRLLSMFLLVVFGANLQCLMYFLLCFLLERGFWGYGCCKQGGIKAMWVGGGPCVRAIMCAGDHTMGGDHKGRPQGATTRGAPT